MLSRTQRSNADTFFWILSWLALAIHLSFFMAAPPAWDWRCIRGFLSPPMP